MKFSAASGGVSIKKFGFIAASGGEFTQNNQMKFSAASGGVSIKKFGFIAASGGEFTQNNQLKKIR